MPIRRSDLDARQRAALDAAPLLSRLAPADHVPPTSLLRALTGCSGFEHQGP